MMIFKNCVWTILVAPLMVGSWVINGCSMAADTSTIRVGIGMTADELVKGSSYPLESAGKAVKDDTGSTFPAQWMITAPYDLKYNYKSRELHKENIGGDNYFIAITTNTQPDRNIEYIHITYQNRAFTLEEALAEAKSLNDWFTASGFVPQDPHDPTPGRYTYPFYVEKQVGGAPKYSKPIKAYDELHAAFRDENAKIIEITPFSLQTSDVYAGLSIKNAQRSREDLRGAPTPLDPPAERTYFLNLTISSRAAP